MNFDEYQNFIKEGTSEESEEFISFNDRLNHLNDHCNISLLLTASMGLSSETGEFNEIVKKCVFQGKPFDDSVEFHLKRELGDILWYWTNACRSLGIDPIDVMNENVSKLKSRYPEGFSVNNSENRKDGDI